MLLAGLLLFLFPDKLRTVKGIIALIVSIITGYLTILIYSSDNIEAGTISDLTNGIRSFNLRDRSTSEMPDRYAHSTLII